MNKRLREYLDLKKDTKIYCTKECADLIKDNTIDLSERINTFIKGGFDTYFDSDASRIQCYGNRFRSFTDLYIIFRTYIPELDIHEFAYKICLFMHFDQLMYGFKCPNIRKVVFVKGYASRGGAQLKRDYDLDYGSPRVLGCDGVSWNNMLIMADRYARKNKLNTLNKLIEINE